MTRLLRFSALNLGLAYVVASLVSLALFALPLSYAWEGSIEQGRVDLMRAEGRRWADLAERKGVAALTDAVALLAGNGTLYDGSAIVLLVDPSRRKLAGNLPRWPAGLADSADAQSVELRIDGRATITELVQQPLSGGYRLLIGRDIDRFEALETLFWTGLLGAAAILLCLGTGAGWIMRRSLLNRVRDIDLAARAVMQGDLSHWLPAYVGEVELNALVETENRMLDQIQHLVEGVRNVSNSIAHDLRTPLTELRTRLEEVAATRPGPAQVFGQIDAAIGDVDRVIGIFNALLRMAEIDSGVRRAGFVEVDLAHLARDAVEFYAPLAELKGVSLVAFAPAAAAVVRGDPTLLAQALGNLIDNAVKYVHPGGRVEVHVEAGREACTLAVSDDGPGIAAGDEARVLERFYRGDASRGTPGAGLGLSLAATVAHLHLGELALAHNHPGLRATLTLAR